MNSRRSDIHPLAVLKIAGQLIRHPWVGGKLAVLQGEKVFFNLLHPLHGDGRAGKIRQISFRLTDQCNLRCATCGQWGKAGFLHGKNLKTLKRNEVPSARYLEVLRDLVRHGHRPLVYLWGGEPMLYDGTLDLIETATGMGLPTSIATNSTGIFAAAHRLVKAPLFLLQVSIDGHCAELHDSLRPAVGGTSNFRSIVNALECIRRERRSRNQTLPLIASLTVISKGNEGHLVDIYDAFRGQVDLFVFYLSWWIDDARARAHESAFSRPFGFTPKLHRGWVSDWKPKAYGTLQAQLRKLQSRSRGWRSPPVLLIPNITGEQSLRRYYSDHANRFGFDQCISIHQAVEVDSNGDVSPCRDYHDYTVGNIKQTTVTQLWNSAAFRRFRHSIADDGLMPVCSRCCGLMGY